LSPNEEIGLTRYEICELKTIARSEKIKITSFPLIGKIKLKTITEKIKITAKGKV